MSPYLPDWMPRALAERVEVFPDRASWLLWRSEGAYRVGGTLSATLIGRSRWAGPWDAWNAAHGTAEPIPVDAATVSAGLWWEPTIARWYAEHCGAEVWGGLAVCTHPVLGWAFGSFDGIARRDGEVGILEIKTARSREGWARHGTLQATAESDAVAPLDYLVQVYWYLTCSGLPWADLVVMFGPQDVRVYRILADPRFQASLLRRVATARQRYLVRGEAPDLDASEACVAAMNAIDRSGMVEIGPEVIAAAETYDAAKAARVEAQKAEKLAKVRLLAAMGEHSEHVHTPEDGKPRRIVWQTGRALYTRLQHLPREQNNG